MTRVIEKTGKTVEEAIQAAVAELGVAKSELEVEVLETPTKKFFGLLGETPAKIRATVKIAPPVEVKETSQPAEKISAENEPAEEDVAEPVKEFEPVLEPSPVEEKNSTPAPFEREQVVDEAKKFLQEVFATMGLEVTINVTEEAEDSYLFELVGKNLGVLIGRRGQALDALQYLVNLSVNRKTDNKLHFTLDAEDYRRRREEALTKLAKSVAERAIKTRKDVRLEPMNRHERKIIHTVLQDNERVETHSAGEDPYRYIIVTPVKRGRR